MCPPLFHTSQLVINDVVVERILGAISLLVLLLQLRPQLCFVYVLGGGLRRRCQAQGGVDLLSKKIDLINPNQRLGSTKREIGHESSTLEES